jgi:hypothetical protein
MNIPPAAAWLTRNEETGLAERLCSVETLREFGLVPRRGNGGWGILFAAAHARIGVTSDFRCDQMGVTHENGFNTAHLAIVINENFAKNDRCPPAVVHCSPESVHVSRQKYISIGDGTRPVGSVGWFHIWERKLF